MNPGNCNIHICSRDVGAIQPPTSSCIYGYRLCLDLSIRFYRGNCRYTNPRDSTLHDPGWSEFISAIDVMAMVRTLTSLRQFWCWIGNGSRYNAERYAGEYAWMWTALAVSVITYIPLSVVARGIELGVNRNRWYIIELRKQDGTQAEGQTRRSINMIAYVIY